MGSEMCIRDRLGLIATEHLYRSYPDYAEGHLAKLRAAVVSTAALANRARELRLGPLIRLGRGETLTGGADKDSILADTMEALIGAVYVSAGRDAANAYVHRVVDSMVLEADKLGAGLEWKMSLHDLCSHLGLASPSYVHESSGFVVANLARSPLTDSELSEVADVVDAAVAQTVAQGGHVEIIAEHPALEGAGRIGAILRY